MGMGPTGPAFDDFVRASSTDLLRLAVLLTQDRQDAEDLLQVAFVRTAGRWRQASRDPVPYTRRVIVNLAKNRWRDRSRRPRVVGDLTLAAGAEADPGNDPMAEHDALSTVLAGLPPGQHRVLVLRYFADLPVSEVADLLGCSEGAVKSQTSRALSSLRARLASRDNDPVKGASRAD